MLEKCTNKSMSKFIRDTHIFTTYTQKTNRQPAGPGPALPLAWARPAAAWYFVVRVYNFGHLWVGCLVIC